MAAWVMAAAALAQLAYGAYQKYQGDQMKAGLVRPNQEIPPEILSKLSTAQIRAIEGMPAEQRNQYITNIQRASNFGLRSLSDRKAGIAGLSGLVQAQDDAYLNLAVEDAKMRRENEKYLGTVQSEVSGWKDKLFQTNQLDPYNQKSQAAAAMQGAGIQNIGSGIQTGVNAYGQQQYLDTLKEINGVGDKTEFNIPYTGAYTTGTAGGRPGDDDYIASSGTGIGSAVDPAVKYKPTTVSFNSGIGNATTGGLQGGLGALSYNIPAIRAKYPQYAGLSDEQILKRLGY